MRQLLTEIQKQRLTAVVDGTIVVATSVFWDYVLVRILSKVVANVPHDIAVLVVVLVLPGAIAGIVIQAALFTGVVKAIRLGEI